MIMLRFPKDKVDNLAEHIEHSLRHMGKAMQVVDDIQHEAEAEEENEAMHAYINEYGWHFNKKASDMACANMKRLNPATSMLERITPWTKEEVDAMLQKHGVKLKNAQHYDHVYVANMGQADYLKSSVPDETHLALYVKDTVDDVDGSSELPFRYWIEKCEAMGWEIPWEELL